MTETNAQATQDLPHSLELTLNETFILSPRQQKDKVSRGRSRGSEGYKFSSQICQNLMNYPIIMNYQFENSKSGLKQIELKNVAWLLIEWPKQTVPQEMFISLISKPWNSICHLHLSILTLHA